MGVLIEVFLRAYFHMNFELIPLVLRFISMVSGFFQVSGRLKHTFFPPHKKGIPSVKN